MYCFTPYAMPESLKREVDKFEVESIRENAEWKITKNNHVITYTLVKNGDKYVIIFDYEPAENICIFYMLNNGDICIEYAEWDGEELTTSDKLKYFHSTTMLMCGLIQSGKIA